jgi:23S rRNA (cytidine1920-2'-O)/16S rRNA (cytidine1409-2'-O)-methyltransferase
LKATPFEKILQVDKVRVDRLVVERGLAVTREKARRLVLAGEVLVNDVPVEKPGTLVSRDAAMRLRRLPSPFVGRGGEKLAGALQDLDLDVTGLRVLDVGASTGGFTDCLLQRGASRVTALDVGKGQLDWKLRTDPRVKVVEGVNARHLRSEDFPDRFDLVTVDVSFISLTKIFPAVIGLLSGHGRLLALVKPQFELGRGQVEAGGVVRDAGKHYQALRGVAEAAAGSDLTVEGLVASRLTGLEGNREFFLLMRPDERKEASRLDAEEFERRAKRVCNLE